ncbi:hypothetical protein PUR57_05055 [Streptomyces sp. JV176]|uniref:hypothetical protein n=1 Tax=Streptomyces sp. JV176 TaxID=858630 RepID=UPI002E78331E|nr:hypothetical protein [Streptomyces sp. JV176]MEE1798053.1 hypothetical protein [Streptomyces sp. JV176]
MDLVEAGAGHSGRRPAGRALEPDRAALVRGLLEAQVVRLAGGDLLAEQGVVVDAAYGFVAEVEGRLGEGGGHGGAGEGSVDEQGAFVGALDAPVLSLVVEDELVAEASCGLGEVFGDLVGIGAVGRQDPGGKAERGQRGQGVDRVRAGPLAGAVQDKAEYELRVPADALSGLGVAVRVPAAGSDEERGGVPEDPFVGAAAVVPACGDLDGRETAMLAGFVVPGGNRGGVDADIALPALEQAPAVSEADRDQDQAVTDLLQQGPAAYSFGIGVLPGRDRDHGLVGGQPTAAVAAEGVQRGGQPVEGPVDATGERVSSVSVERVGIRNPQPAPGRSPQLVQENAADIREARAAVVVQRQQQSHQHGPHRQALRSGPPCQLGVDQLEHTSAVQESVELADFGVLDLERRVGDWPWPALPDLLRTPPGPRLGHRSGPRRSRAAVALSMGGTRCCQRAREAAEASPAACAIRW